MRKALFVVCVLGLCSMESWGTETISETPTMRNNFKRNRSYSERSNNFPKPKSIGNSRERTYSENTRIPPEIQNRRQEESYNKTKQYIKAKTLTSSISSADTFSPSPKVYFNICDIVEPLLSIKIENAISNFNLLKNNQVMFQLSYNGKSNLTITVKPTNNWRAVSENDANNFIPYKGFFFSKNKGEEYKLINKDVCSVIINNNEIQDNTYDFVLKLSPTIGKELIKEGTFRDRITVSVSAE